MMERRTLRIDDQWLRRFANTAFTIALAVLVGWALWRYYMLSPWTRDGRVRAETVNVAAEIYGKVKELDVAENQFVHRGDVLFVIDPEEFRYALARAQDTMESRRQDMLIHEILAKRRSQMSAQAISTEEQQTSESLAAQATAAYEEAKAEYDLAKLNLERTVVRSPVNGYIDNLRLRVGDYAAVGQTKLTVIDSDSFWVFAYFEETKIPRIHDGDSAIIELMGGGPDISGHVETISRGIADQNGSTDTQGLANVNPVFYWVRLAQRIPVRIHIDHVPENVTLAAGMTCTVVVKPRGAK
ncbi:MAG TPA: HlyD family secretion protein [Verrucomicrobiae bacterium]|jgi:RND family efflux transporter MFP subunit